MMKKNWIKRAAVLVLTILVAAGAWNMPEIVYSFSDRHTLEKKQHFQLELKQYAKEGSVEEQLYSFALCSEDDSVYTMKAVKMQMDTQSDSDEELTRIIRSEVYRLGEQIEKLGRSLTQDISQLDMTSRELYTAYITSADEGDSRESITFWKVRYQHSGSEEEQYELEVILDMEYHKLYSLKLSNHTIAEQCSRYLEKNKTYAYESMDDEECWNFVEILRSYYGETPAKYTVGIGLDEAYVYDAGGEDEARNEIIGEASKNEESVAKVRDVITLRRLHGNFIFYDNEKGAGYDLGFISQYEIEENGACYMKVEIENLEEILQI